MTDVIRSMAMPRQSCCLKLENIKPHRLHNVPKAENLDQIKYGFLFSSANMRNAKLV
jgi:hypothetical protein